MLLCPACVLWGLHIDAPMTGCVVRVWMNCPNCARHILEELLVTRRGQLLHRLLWPWHGPVLAGCLCTPCTAVCIFRRQHVLRCLVWGVDCRLFQVLQVNFHVQSAKPDKQKPEAWCAPVWPSRYSTLGRLWQWCHGSCYKLDDCGYVTFSQSVYSQASQSLRHRMSDVSELMRVVSCMWICLEQICSGRPHWHIGPGSQNLQFVMRLPNHAHYFDQYWHARWMVQADIEGSNTCIFAHLAVH